MQKWEYTLAYSDGLSYEHKDGSTNISAIWKKQDVWETVKQWGDDGWEMVNAFTTTGRDGETENIVFVFKRPKP